MLTSLCTYWLFLVVKYFQEILLYRKRATYFPRYPFEFEHHLHFPAVRFHRKWNGVVNMS